MTTSKMPAELWIASWNIDKAHFLTSKTIFPGGASYLTQGPFAGADNNVSGFPRPQPIVALIDFGQLARPISRYQERQHSSFFFQWHLVLTVASIVERHRAVTATTQLGFKCRLRIGPARQTFRSQ